MSFKDLHYSLSKFKTDVRTHIARKNPLQSPDTKTLSMWIREERQSQSAMTMAVNQHHETTQAFAQWLAQEEDSEELQDLGYKFLRLMDKQTEIEAESAAKHRQFRQVVRSIRERDQQVLADLREKKQAVAARLEHTQQRSPNSRKQIQHLEQQLVDVEKQLHECEREMGDYKRLALREAFHLRFNAMHEFAQKAAILATTGQRLLKTDGGDDDDDAMMLMDCMLRIDGWRAPEEETRPTVLDKWLLDPDDDHDDAALLTDLEIATVTSQKQAAHVATAAASAKIATPTSAPPQYKEKA